MVSTAGSDRLPDAVPLICGPGDVAMCNRQALHCSFANTSDDVRVTVNFGFHRRRSILDVNAGDANNPVIFDDALQASNKPESKEVDAATRSSRGVALGAALVALVVGAGSHAATHADDASASPVTRSNYAGIVGTNRDDAGKKMKNLGFKMKKERNDGSRQPLVERHDKGMRGADREERSREEHRTDVFVSMPLTGAMSR